MICAKDTVALELFPDVKFSFLDEKPVLYIGISGKQGLRKRDYRNHFEGTARSSTLRKSIGSLFMWETERVYYNDGKYRFSNEREDALSQWMKEHLIIAYWITTRDNIDSIETQLINEMSPPLNISKNYSVINSIFRKRLKELRR